MSEYVIISIVTLIGAGLTLFSGFGLGTLLLPVFGLFFPIDIAIAMTAIVHFSNNLIKLGFFRKSVSWEIILVFGIPSIVASFLGAFLLTKLSGLQPLYSYSIRDNVFEVSPVKLVIALLLMIFSLWELLPGLSKLQFHKKYLPVGGVLSGFFGGLAGIQGALRSAFLVRAGLTKEMFIGTGVVIACLVDISRLTVYSGSMLTGIDDSLLSLLAVAVISAFAGVFIGTRIIHKVTLKALQVFVAVLLFLFSGLLALGII